MKTLSFEKSKAKEIASFFETYNQPYGMKFKVIGVAGPGKAYELIKFAIKAYRKKKKRG